MVKVMKTPKGGIYRRFIKRPMDILFSLLAIVILSPMFLLIAFLVRIKLGSPVLFKQKRPGLNEKIFTIYKFRSMTNERDENGELLPDRVRLTKFGRFLRSTSLDELPELFNILKGDMSFVGPRPLLINYLPYYSNGEKLRHNVRPGLTGWAQVSGRNFLGWNLRLEKDIEYVLRCSFVFDLRIIYLTSLRVAKKRDIAVDTNEVEPNFAAERKQRWQMEERIDEYSNT